LLLSLAKIVSAQCPHIVRSSGFNSIAGTGLHALTFYRGARNELQHFRELKPKA
jgi:hypothetical protein